MDVKDLNKIRLIVADVDGTMTDGGIYYDETGNELKKFCTRDAAGYFAAHQVGIKIMVLTGRECQATTRRMQEMKIDFLCQDVKDKYTFLKNFMQTEGYVSDEVAYIGDDLNDLYPMTLVGYIGCPNDAYPELTAMANYISSKNGGQGAVRDFIEHILAEREQWEIAVSKAYDIPIELLRAVARKTCCAK